MTQPHILIFDSGLGGLTVFREVAAARPDARFTYLADDAGFPYGPLPPEQVIARVVGVLSDFVREHAPDLVVIACNTASTLVLPPLRAAFPALPFVGTVPAIKPAAATSRSRMVSVLATPGTAARDYTRDLVAAHAADCAVTLVGAPNLARLAEDFLRDRPVSTDDVRREIEPCFRQDGTRRTDIVVLACTHYPLLRPMLVAAAPWPVIFIDPAPAIARRVESLLPPAHTRAAGARHVQFTSGTQPEGALAATLRGFGLADSESEATQLCA